jgi:hypothetical protein
VSRRVASRLAACLLAGLLAVAALPSPAAASPVLDDADAVELAQALAEATAVQDVCYGWRVDLRDDSGGPSGEDVGSSRGPDVALDPAACERWVLLEGAIHYTSEISESEDDASLRIASNLSPAPTEADLRQLGVTGSLTDEDNDVVLLNMVEALPLAVASNGQAPYVEFEIAQTPVAGQGEPTGTPGSDVLRQWWPLMVLCVLAILAGVVMLLGRLLSLAAARGGPTAADPRQGR